MKLISLTTLNFMPFKGEMRLAFPQNPTQNVMVVFGDNMRGKTSLLNALRWTFYGRAFGRHLREIPLHELPNKDAGSEGDWSVEAAIQFEAEGHRYDLRRRATKRALVDVPSRPEDYDVTVGLQKDGMAVSGHLIEAEVNRFAPEQVSRFFLFDGELLQEYESLLIEGSDQGRRIKEAIEQVLGVPTLINGRDELSTLLKDARRQQNKDLAHVKGLERQAESQGAGQRKQESHEVDLAALRNRLGQTRTDRVKLEDELEKVDSIHESKIRLDLLVEKKKEITEARKLRTAHRLRLMQEAWRDLLQPKLVVKRNFLRNEHDRLTEQIARRSRLESSITDLRKYLDGGACPTCGEPLHDDRRGRAGTKLGELELELRAIDVNHDALSRVSAEIREIDRLIKPGVGPAIREADAELRKLSVDLTKTENEIAALTKDIAGYDTAEIARNRVQHSGLLKEEGRLENDIDACQKKVEEAKRELAIIAKTLQSLPAARASRSTAMANVCLTLERVFNESIERLREDLRLDVQQRATEAFRSLTTQRAYRGLEINQNYGLTIIDERGKPVTIRSAGAEQIVALSLIDGLARTGRAAGPVVMDTPFGRLDLRHRDNILQYLPTTTSQLILLVHSGEIRRETDLVPIADRIGAAYEIIEVNPRYSRVDKVTS